jgi:hypothetical protein
MVEQTPEPHRYIDEDEEKTREAGLHKVSCLQRLLSQEKHNKGRWITVGAAWERKDNQPGYNVNFLATPLTYVVDQLPSRMLQSCACRQSTNGRKWQRKAGSSAMASFSRIWRQRAQLLVKVLRGINPADLPVEQPTRV